MRSLVGSIFWFSTSKKDLSELTIRLLLPSLSLGPRFFVIRNLSYLGSRILIIRMGKALPLVMKLGLLCQFWLNHITILGFQPQTLSNL